MRIAFSVFFQNHLHYNYSKKKRGKPKKVRAKIRACAEYFPAFYQKEHIRKHPEKRVGNRNFRLRMRAPFNPLRVTSFPIKIP